MGTVILRGYTESKPHRLKRVVWALVNRFLFPFVGNFGRIALLRMFGAKIGASVVYGSVKIYAPWNLVIGDFSCVGPRVEIYSKAIVTIGDHSVVSQDAYICTASHDTSSPVMASKVGAVHVSNSCWVASRAVLLPNVSLGEGAVVGCAAVVTKDVAAWTIVGGNPAKFIKKRELKD